MKKYYIVIISISILLLGIACIKKWDIYGHSGVENLHMNEKMNQSLERFQNSIKNIRNLDLISTQIIISDSLYSKLVSTNLNSRDSLIKIVLTEFNDKEDSKGRGSSYSAEKSTIAVISYFSFGGENKIAFAEDGLKLFYLDESKISLLAQNIGANY
ncbi:MAG: hypothetical protein JXB24_14590 [Bacteroidales bacterium]|nr:hypothetical protein [Bacteroidales bacterium]